MLEELCRFDTCTLADALETFDVRLRNQGYTRHGLRCLSGNFPPVAGFAVTARVRSSDPPMLGRSYVNHDEWWRDFERVPRPRIVVIQDVDPDPGTGACIGQLAAAIFQALDCVAAVTNGAVRDLPAIAELRLPVFACHVSPSHSYAHIVDHGQPVEVRGLLVQASDVLVADQHGVLSIPAELVPALPAAAGEICQRKRNFVDFCRSGEFSLDRLREELRHLKP